MTPSSIPLKPIKPKKISDQVCDQLMELIYRGYLKPGEKLMPERSLAEVLGVSRPTVREAINKLVTMGLLEHRQGQGTFVRHPAKAERNPLFEALDVDNASLVEILEVRMGLECNAASLAALRADERDLEFLKESLEEMKKDVASGGLGHEADVSFHMAISYATKNPVQVRIMRNMYDILFFGIKQNLQGLYKNPENIEIIISQHRAIFEAIQSRDPEQAEEAMRRHITFVRDYFARRPTSSLAESE
ncbi:FadR/GntR family transcriptional regulator [Thermodesulforhabdus norvegica]|uniref:Transcriptional regulator, GntR family n=1 Tax=Thermodesulforhabdus norvegica TaxID=39841 RepID=A0A1I4W620_9BACT|nr:FadR/GntR family transcriptional regulator [Thermodesulforhabdus norvegica]SFN09144.1 transcriptional regulator, GntR family [Thermodesulforhabdus norvegica]